MFVGNASSHPKRGGLGKTPGLNSKDQARMERLARDKRL